MIDAAHSVIDSLTQQIPEHSNSTVANEPKTIAAFCELLIMASVSVNNIDQALLTLNKFKQLLFLWSK